ncbi:MAG: PSD1 and planctomycete cytochrome C domain-containing protein [Deltaproteobacteria bacterium]|nr:PSD1 and planctomycete cytochrome C domain-containing protein [Deltaproteobacteria bacterium]
MTSIAILASWLSVALTPAAPVDFQQHVAPLLAERCLPCHGPEKRKGALRLDAKATALEGGATGPALVPGHGEDSLLIQRIKGLGDEDRMPPEGPPLTPAQIQSLTRWIDEGANWGAQEAAPAPTTADATHWAYRAVARPPVPKLPPSGVPIHGDIDRFVLARLREQGLTMSAPAPRETLLRRVSLDLTGLPPTLAEVDAFVSDKRPDAFARQVDRLLASLHFGERWARWWLDLARYADSHGYEKDRPRVMWKYRDWVIDAFNQNMSWKQFTIEQLAGDMLPSPTISQRIATGFHRNTLINQEGGVDPEEAYFEVLVDRVGTTASVWLGSTLACAQCHNHKFDPFSQKDFYTFMAFFSNNDTALRGSLFNDLHMGEPILTLPTPAQSTAREKLAQEMAEVQRHIDSDSAERRAAQRLWEQKQREAELQWQVLPPQKATSQGGAKLAVLSDGSVLASGPAPAGDTYDVVVHATLPNITALRLEVLPDKSLPKGGPGRAPDGGFLLTGFAASRGNEASTPLMFSTAAADEQIGGFGPATLLRKNVEGWAIDVAAAASSGRRQAVFVLREPMQGGGTLRVRLSHMPRALRAIGKFRLSATSGADPLFITQVPRRDRELLQVPESRRSTAQQDRLATLHRNNSSHFAPERARLRGLQKQVDELGIVTAMVLQERPGFERPSAFVRARGGFASPTEKVFANVPKSLPPLPPDAPANRLGLARWLVSDSNPLTARVTVNRFWEQLFGRGLVETSEDLGTQSPPPSHPELLDWLASEYMRLGWNTKALLRTIVLSATYQQSSRVRPDLLAKDPTNRWFARGPRFRLDAETLRDLALRSSGLLATRVGGPSVYPWQPAGVWDVPYNEESLVWKTSGGEDAHRRTLYTFLRRSAPYPLLINFDATSRETCTLKRPRTNTPLQALNILNDAVFFEAAQSMAARMQEGAGTKPAARLSYGFRLVTGRHPTSAELQTLNALFASQRERLRKDPSAVKALLTNPTVEDAKPPGVADPERAALTLVANVLLNLDEAVTKE